MDPPPHTHKHIVDIMTCNNSTISYVFGVFVLRFVLRMG